VAGLAFEGWGFDRLYTAAFVRPFLWLARRGKDDFIDAGFSTVAWSARRIGALLSSTQTGRVRYYVAVAAFGAVLFVALGIFR
jgi:NADH-quinone oxidoreductase subunit L